MKGMTVKLGALGTEDLAVKVRAGRELGFENFDLAISASNVRIADVVRQVRTAGGRVRSLRLAEPAHTLIDAGVAGFAKLASLDGRVRAASVSSVIAACRAVGGSDVTSIILDGGDVTFPGAREARLELDGCLEEAGCSAGVKNVLAKVLERRAVHVYAHLEALCNSVHEIIKASEGIHLAFLTPDSALGVCLPDEMEHVLKDGGGRRRGYWHSTCNARELEKLGIASQEAWLDRFGNRMKGVYLSDTVGGQGGEAPGLGDVDFKRLKPYLGAGTARVLAITDDSSALKLKYGVEFLSDAGIF